MKRVLAAAVALCAPGVAFAQPRVHVVVDINPYEPGIQYSVVVGPTDRVLPGVAVYIFAVEGAPQMRALGYIGAIDRGLSFGHAPHKSNRGNVTRLVPHEGTPIVPGANIEILRSDGCCMQQWFEGPEVQYLELGGPITTIPAWPTPPVFTVDIELTGPRVRDQFNFHLLDAVAANFGGGTGNAGMFTTMNAGFIDTGGDAVPDLTPTVFGLDPDSPVPVPPGSFVVDLINGPPPAGRGGATIFVSCRADIIPDGLNSMDFFEFMTFFFTDEPRADFNRDDVVNTQDFFDFLEAFFVGCS